MTTIANLKRSRIANKECSVARAMEAIGDRWSILLLREAYYGVKRFDEFQHYVGIAPNILSTRLKKFVHAGIMVRIPLPERVGRYEYMLTEKGRDFFPTYLALKKWGDDWLAGPAGPQVVFHDRFNGQEIQYPQLLTARGEQFRLEDIEIVAGSGAIGFHRKRFGASPARPDASRSKTSAKPRAQSSKRKGK